MHNKIVPEYPVDQVWQAFHTCHQEHSTPQAWPRRCDRPWPRTRGWPACPRTPTRCSPPWAACLWSQTKIFSAKYIQEEQQMETPQAWWNYHRRCSLHMEILHILLPLEYSSDWTANFRWWCNIVFGFNVSVIIRFGTAKCSFSIVTYFIPCFSQICLNWGLNFGKLFKEFSFSTQ